MCFFVSVTSNVQLSRFQSLRRLHLCRRGLLFRWRAAILPLRQRPRPELVQEICAQRHQEARRNEELHGGVLSAGEWEAPNGRGLPRSTVTPVRRRADGGRGMPPPVLPTSSSSPSCGGGGSFFPAAFWGFRAGRLLGRA